MSKYWVRKVDGDLWAPWLVVAPNGEARWFFTHPQSIEWVDAHAMSQRVMS